MSMTLCFLIKDASEPDQVAVILTTPNNSFKFEDLMQYLVSVIDHEDMLGRFQLPLASREITTDIVAFEGVAIARFTYHDVERSDWTKDLPAALAKQNTDCQIVVADPKALALMVKVSARPLSIWDVCGPWNGVVVIEND